MLNKVFSTQTWKQSQITIIGSVTNGILGLLFYTIMARALGPSSFGLLTVSIITLTLISDIVDFGTNTGLVRFVSTYLNIDETKAMRFLKLGLETKLLVWIIILIPGLILSPFIANNLFNKPELITPLRLVTIGVGGALLFSYATSSLQAFQKFFLWSTINVTSNLFRLILIIILFFTQQLNLFSGLLSYIILPFFGFFVALFFLPTKKIINVSNERNVAQNFFKFNKWIAIFTIISAFSSRLDIFLTTRLLSPQDIGIYGAASLPTQIVPQIIGALGAVAAPKFASFQDNTQMLKYFKKFQFLVLGLSLLVALGIPASFYLLPILYGVDYIPSIFPFIILLLAMIVFLVSIPLHNSIIYYFGRSDVFVWVALIHLLIVGCLGYFLIGNYGVIGTALTVLIGMIANFLLPLFWFVYKLRK